MGKPDINIKAEVLISLRENKKKPYIVGHKSTFERNFENDLADYTSASAYDEYMVSRDSLYHLLPEGLFHKIDRFKGIAQKDQSEKFKNNWEIQEKERQKALAFFKPFDNELFHVRIEYQEGKAEQSLFAILARIAGWDIPEKPDAYIGKALHYLPFIANIKGDKRKLKIILEIILEANLNFRQLTYNNYYQVEEGSPIEGNVLEDDCRLGNVFCNNGYYDTCFLFLVEMQKKVTTTESIQKEENELKAFCNFFQQYFLPVEEDFKITIGDFKKSPVIDELEPLFLGYNTQLV